MDIPNSKRMPFRVYNREELNMIQRDLRMKTRVAKEKYRRKLEWKLQQKKNGIGLEWHENH